MVARILAYSELIVHSETEGPRLQHYAFVLDGGRSAEVTEAEGGQVGTLVREILREQPERPVAVAEVSVGIQRGVGGGREAVQREQSNTVAAAGIAQAGAHVVIPIRERGMRIIQAQRAGYLRHER